MLLVARRAKTGTPERVVRENMEGACGGLVTESPYSTRVPANKAWLPADSTDVRMTVFMNEPATPANAVSEGVIIVAR